MKSQVLVVGPGYVGREIIDLLLSEGQYHVTTLVRRQAAVDGFERCGVRTILGDLNDSTLITKVAAESDIIFHTATADHLASAQAILDGIARRASQGKHTIYLHQSGAGVLSDASPGNNQNNETFTDATASQIDTLAETAPHRQIDLAILGARKKLGDKAKIGIFMPPIIYGSNPKYQRLSIQVPALTRFAIKHGYAGYVRDNQTTWAVVHVLDLAKAYVRVLHWLEIASSTDPGLANPYFFCESGETTWYAIARMIGDSLYRAGKVASAEPRLIPETEYADLFRESTPDVVGCNAKNRSERLRTMGWKPEQRSLVDAFVEELPVLLSEKEFKASDMMLS